MKVTVFNWKEGTSRPGSDPSYRDDCIDTIELKKGIPVPMRGDILRLRVPKIDEPTADNEPGTTSFLIIERELVCSFRKKKSDSRIPLKLEAMRLYVRELEDPTKPVKLPEPHSFTPRSPLIARAPAGESVIDE